jgi:NhaP-type Na+/H+ or K+/H+ antiporter
MRLVVPSALTGLVLAIGLLVAPAADAAGKDKPSSNLPWAIGVGVLVVLAIAVLLLKLRRGMGKRDESGHFRA